MADNFDPDKYLAETSKVEDSFDPDAYLAETAKPEEIGVVETAARSLGQGATMGFLDELMAGLKASGGASPSQVISDPKKAIQKEKEMMKSYEEELGKQRDITKQIREESPVLSTGLEIAGGIAPALLTGGAGAAAQLGKAVSKGGVSTIGAIGKATKEGAKFGGISALGESEAEAPTELVKDVAVGAGLGAGLGAAIPVAGQAIKGTGKLIGKGVQAIPGTEAISLGYQAGKKGIGIGQEDILEEGMRVAKKLSDKITKVFQDSGMDRKKAMELAEQANVRINAGELLDEVLEDIAETGATGLNIDAKKKLYDQLSSLKKGSNEAKQYKKLEMKAAKQALKDEEAYGSVVETTSEINRPLDTILPLAEGKGNIQGIRTKFSVKDPAGDVQTYVKNVLQEIQENPVKLKEFDPYSLSPSEAKLFKESIDELVGDLGRSANPQEAIARRLSADIDRRIKDAVSGVSDSTKTMSKVFRGAEKLGVSEPGRTSEYALEDSIDKFAKKLLSSGNAAEIDKRSAFKAFKSASPEFNEVIDEAEFVSKLNEKLGGMTEGVRTTNIRGLLGTAEGGVAKLANVAGKVSNKATKVIQPVTKVANKVGQYTDTQFTNAATKMVSSDIPGVQALGKQLQFALQQEGPVKNAAIWSLSQQPAFREAARQFLNEGEEATSDVIGTEPMNIGEPARVPQNVEMEEPISEEVQNIDNPEEASREPAASEFLVEKETTSNVGYVPKKSNKSGVTIATGLDLGNFDLKNLDVPQSLKDKLIPFTGLKGDEARKVASNLKISNDEVKLIDDALDKHTTSKIIPLLKDIPESIISDDFIDGLKSFHINTSTGARTLVDRIKSGDIDEAIAKAIEWNKTGGKFAAGLLQRRMEELYKMFPDKVNLIQQIGKQQYDKYQNKTKMSWDQINTIKSKSLQEPKINRQPMGEPVSMDKLQELQKNLNAHQKYVQSGGSAVYSSTGDRLMGSIDNLDIAPELKQEAQDAVIEGDIPKLRAMLDQLRNIS